MKITLIGAGCGSASLTEEARLALRETQLVLGARRLLDALSDVCPPDVPRITAVASGEIISQLEAHTECADACVLLSGDSGFYSGAGKLLPLLSAHDVRVLPGISSVQMLAARLGRPWQDWKLCSAHGVDCDVLAAVCAGKPTFFLTSGSAAPAEVCRTLTQAGLGELTVTVAEALGSADERILSAPAESLTERSFSALNVVLTEAAPRFVAHAPGLPDALFRRVERVPMTKQEVRAAVISKLGVTPEDVCWDIGAGTGSVSVELALHARAVWAVERDAAALDAAEANRKQFGAWNLRIVPGEAPEALAALPSPDKVFIGGTGGKMRPVLRAIHATNAQARICISAITLESLQQSVSELEALGYETEVTQIAVSRSRRVGESHMMLAQNPVYLIVGNPV
ncbi:MAG: precorrin-6y C5,15-methyltransferase (decarboxylating) subunit CbiE [Oscillospiraceae bacterium]|nr:precorrin-6y C5,15-methyltransferase (decarboxylating) subunit CbiE [Oscillospiraceae bacterium]